MKDHITKQLREIATCWWRLLRLCWSLCAPTLLLLSLLMLLAGLVPALEVQITKTLVQTVQLAIESHGKPELISVVIFFGLAQAGIAVALTLLHAGQEYAQRVLQLQLVNRVGILVMQKAVALDLQHFEDDQLYDQLQRARQEGISRPYETMLEILTAI